MIATCPQCKREFRSGSEQFDQFAALAGEGRLALLIGCAGCGLLFAPPGGVTARDAERYEMIRVIGRGGMGVTWLARDRITDRQVCVKQLQPDIDFSSLRQEWSALKALDHPSIVRLLDFQDTSGAPMLVMEYVDGQSLDAVLRGREVLPEPVALDIALQLCESLDFVHARSVIHRDIKPANILVEWRNDRLVPRVLDFGIAIVNNYDADNAFTAIGNFAGSMPYMAPEQIRAELLTPLVDEYAIGVTIAEMVCGRSNLAFFGDQYALYQVKVGADGIVLDPRTATPETVALVYSLTRQEPSARLSARAAAEHIRSILPEMHDRESLAPIDLDLAGSAVGSAPIGWYNGRGTVDNVDDRYAITTLTVDGERALELRSSGEREAFGTAMQRVPARHLAGHVLRFAADVATRGCRSASLWVRADGQHPEQLAFDNMSDRALHGSAGWTRCTIDFTVPAGTAWLNFGVLLVGGGTAVARRFALVDLDCNGRDVSHVSLLRPSG